MRLLLLFVTQAQGGAPGYLSRKGEDAAANLAETLGQFCSAQLGLQLEPESAHRASSLSRNPEWKELGRPGAIIPAFAASAALYPDIALASGATPLCMKTMEAVATCFALPVVVHLGLDRATDSLPPSAHTLTTALPELLGAIGDTSPFRVLILGTTRTALLEWLGGKLSAEQHAETKIAFASLSGEDELPFVYTVALNGDVNDASAWLFD